jgi:HK97 gp10 family phage protein
MADGPTLGSGETYFEWSARQQATGGPLVIEVQGLEELQKALAGYGAEWDKVAKEALGIGLATLESEAKKKAPVDTSRLQSSIGSQIQRAAGSEIVGKTGSNLEYASYQEYGTRYQSGKPYLRPALEENLSNVVRQFEEGIDRALKHLGLR